MDYISSYLTVKKTGANYRALCPFHSEKTPSLMISQEKQIFKCFGCFTKGTEIMTEFGLKNIEQINQGELVRTHKGRLKRVITTFKRKYVGQIVNLRTRQTSEIVRLTPDHKVFLIKTQNCKQKSRSSRLCQSNCKQNCPTKFFKSYKIEKLPISEAKIGDYLIYPFDVSECDIKTVRLYDFENYLKIRKQIRTGFLAQKIPEVVAVNSHLLKFLGYWIAEGSTYPRGIRFSLGSHEKDFALEIAALGKKVFGLTAGIHYRSNGKNGIEISISNIFLPEIMIGLCGKNADNKKIPDFCLKLPVRKQKILLEAIFRGDGSTGRKYSKSRAGRKSVTTISNQLAFQIKNILLRMEHVPVVTFKDSYTDKKSVHHRPSWTISWISNLVNNYTDFLQIDKNLIFWLLPIKELEKQNFSGNVYNLMIEDDSSYIVKNFVVGNCGEGGDIFEFVQKMENLNFRETLEMLANRAGVKLEKYRQSPEYQKEKDQKTRIFQLNNFAAAVFEKILWEHSLGKIALKYLRDRGLTDETIKTFNLGYAPSHALLPLLKKRGFTDEEIRLAGNPDRFFQRIVFPIKNVLGSVVGFTGRVLDPQVQPKYLNTPETPVFKKGQLLYNLDKARGEIKLEKATVLVEGQMDVIMSYQAGVKNVVASSGTALTNDHLQTLYRYTPNIIFSFDGDTAGLTSAKKAYEMAIIQGMNVKMVSLDDYKDPGEMVVASPKLWQEAVKKAKPVIDWYFELAFKKFEKNDQELDPQDKKAIAKEILPIILKIPDSIEQAHYLGILAKKLAVPEKILYETLAKNKEQKNAAKPIAKQEEIKPSDHEATILGLLYLFPEKMNLLVKRLKSNHFQNPQKSDLYTHLLTWYNNDEKINLKTFLLGNVDSKIIKELELWALAAEETYPEKELIDQVIIDICQKIISDHNEKIKQHFALEIRRAEEAGDRDKLKLLIKEFQNAIT